MRRYLSLLAGLCFMLGLLQPAWALSEAKFKAFDYPTESTFEFAIVDQNGQRMATAYYRVLLEKSNDEQLYRLKYVGRNDAMSEASECWIKPASLLPVRATRKFVNGGHTLFQDVAYGKGIIILRRKFDASPVEERQIPAPSGLSYDYESLMWLIPYLDFSGDTQLKLNVYSMITETLNAVVVNDLGDREVSIGKHTYPARCYSFSVGMVPYTYWSVMQNGIAVPAKVDMDRNSFINTKLDPKKVTAPKAAKPADKTPPAKKPENKPKPPEKKENGDDDNNPLGPPPPGSRF